VGETPPVRQSPAVGTLSPDGSRRWDGRFWVPIRNDDRLPELPPPPAREPTAGYSPDRRRLRLGGVILASVVGVALFLMPLPAPGAGSLEGALTELAVLALLRVLLPFVAVVLILSVGRQGLDVLLLRGLLTAFLMGAALIGLFLGAVFLGPIPVPVELSIPWPVAVTLGGLLLATLLGPMVTFVAALANLLWYRSLRSLRAQFGTISRLVLALPLVANIGYLAWVFARAHNLGSTVLYGFPAVATLVMMFLLRNGDVGVIGPPSRAGWPRPR
jgi:hypothetical protein